MRARSLHENLYTIYMSYKLPFFSCVIPVKGDRPFFKDALASLEAQGLGEELEVIVQDGGEGSGGGGELVSGGVESGGVRWFREKDVGQSDALNKGFAKAKGEWLFWLNADDVLLPGALKKIHALISSRAPSTSDEVAKAPSTSAATPHESTFSWLAGDTVYIDEQGKVRDVRCDARWRSWFGKKLSVWTGGPSAFFRRELWEKRGGFDAALKYAMDIDLWTRWAKAGEKFVGLGDYVWGFRVHDGSQTMNGGNSAAQIAERRAIDAKHGVSSDDFWRNVTRLASLWDGSWRKRKSDTARMRGMLWSEIAQ